MFQKIFLCMLTILVMTMEPTAFAGRVELTTYYPAPYGEYTSLNSETFDMNGRSAPDVSPLGKGRIYFDSTANKFQVSENGGAYANLGGGGGLRSVQTFTSTGASTWTKPSGVTKVLVKMVGGGGGGGGANTSGQSGSGGAGGGYGEKLCDVSAVASVSVTAGSGGAGGASGGGAGGDGGTSSFGAYGSASGGQGGKGSNVWWTATPGVGSGCDINGYGTYASGSRGGESVFGRGGRSLNDSSGVGIDAENGFLGSGGGAGSSGNWVATAGGSGGNGTVIVYEYA